MKKMRDALIERTSEKRTLPEEYQNLEPMYILQSTSLQSVSHGVEALVCGDGVYPLKASRAFPRHSALRHLLSNGLHRTVQPLFIA